MFLKRDKLRLDHNFPFQANNVRLYKEDNIEDSFHWHEFCEITLINEGEGSYFVNGHSYTVDCNDLIIFNNTEPHGWNVSSHHLDLTVILFSLDFLPSLNDDYLTPFISRGSNFKNKIGKNEKNTNDIIISIEEICREYKLREQGYKTMIVASMIRLLTFLERHYQNEDSGSNLNEKFTDKKKSMKRIEEALQYIQNHYTEKVSLNQVASSACMSESYFSSYFKKVTGLGFMDYVTDLRIQKALDLMASTDMTRLEIALECGFNNMSNFYKMLKKHGSETLKEA